MTTPLPRSAAPTARGHVAPDHAGQQPGFVFPLPATWWSRAHGYA